MDGGEIKITKMTELYTTRVTLQEKILLASTAIETSYPANVEVNLR